RLYTVHGTRLEAVDQVRAGDLFALTGLSEAAIGQGLGSCTDTLEYAMVPMLMSKVDFDESLHVKDVLNVFQMLDAEDPSLNVTWEESLQESHIHVMGLIQLEVLQQIVKE